MTAPNSATTLLESLLGFEDPPQSAATRSATRGRRRRVLDDADTPGTTLPAAAPTASAPRLVPEWLGHPDPTVRLAGVESLAEQADVDIVSLLAELLSAEPDPVVVRAALVACTDAVTRSDRDAGALAGGLARAVGSARLLERGFSPELRDLAENLRTQLETLLGDTQALLRGVGGLLALTETTAAATATDFVVPEPVVNLRIEEVRSGEANAPEALILIERASADPDPDVRRSALRSLRHGPRELRVEAARSALDDPAALVRRAAVRILDPESPEEVALLARAVTDPDATVVVAAARCFLQHPTAPSLAALWRSLVGRHGDPGTLAGVRALVGLDSPLSPIAAAALESSDPRERTVAVSVLGESALSTMDRWLADPSASVRAAVVRVLTESGGPHHTDALVRYVTDINPEVRLLAVEGLRRSGHDAALGGLLRAVLDPSGQVRDHAFSAISSLPDPDLAERLAESMLHPELGAAARAVVERRDDAAAAASSETPDGPRTMAMRELAATELLDHVDPHVRLRGLATVARSDGGPATHDRVERLLDDPVPAVRIAAARTLARVNPARAWRSLREAFASDPDMTVVTALESELRALDSARSED